MKKPNNGKQQQQEIPMTHTTLAAILSKHGVEVYREHTGMALNQAQRNLAGRTLWAEDANLKTRKSSILAVHVMDDGLILGVVEKAQKTANPDDGVVFRPVFFDVFGAIVDAPELAESPGSQKAAMSELWKRAAEINAIQATIEGAEGKRDAMAQEVEEFSDLVDEIKS